MDYEKILNHCGSCGEDTNEPAGDKDTEDTPDDEEKDEEKEDTSSSKEDNA